MTPNGPWRPCYRPADRTVQGVMRAILPRMACRPVRRKRRTFRRVAAT